MRQPQQNKNRMRNRRSKQANPLNRNYESNGPDVKIRGNAAHIAEKYGSLARDAQASGDHVMAENYLQHAEHYNRLIAAANAQKEATRADNQPQPDVSDDEDGAEPSAANDDAAEEAAASGAPEDDGKRNRRERRPRRPRNSEQNEKPGNEREAAEASGEDDDTEAAARKSGNGSEGGSGRKRSRNREDSPPSMEGVSEDAASLPESILGGAA